MCKDDDRTVALEEVFPDLHAGSAIRGLRYREELTQAQLAEKIGVKRHHISAMETGKRSIGQDMAKRLARALHTGYTLFLQQGVVGIHRVYRKTAHLPN